MKLCVNCRHHFPMPYNKGPIAHMCNSPNREIVSLVTGEGELRSDHPYYLTCEEQRAQRSAIVGDPPRCNHRGDWFEAKQQEAA